MDILEWIARYWINWLCVLISGGVIVFAKHYIKIEKQALEQKWHDKEKNMCGQIICTLETKIKEVENKSAEEDNKMKEDLNNIQQRMELLETGILSIQGRQFKDFCKSLLKKEHIITDDEYEEFEEEYKVYKSLGGNHLGDALHNKVVEKYGKQTV